MENLYQQLRKEEQDGLEERMDIAAQESSLLISLPPELLLHILAVSNNEAHVRQALGMTCRAMQKCCFAVADDFWVEACVQRFGMGPEGQPMVGRSWALTFASLASGKCYFHAHKAASTKSDCLECWALPLCDECGSTDEKDMVERWKAMYVSNLESAEVGRLPYILVRDRRGKEHPLVNRSQLEALLSYRFGRPMQVPSVEAYDQAYNERKQQIDEKLAARGFSESLRDECAQDWIKQQGVPLPVEEMVEKVIRSRTLNEKCKFASLWLIHSSTLNIHHLSEANNKDDVDYDPALRPGQAPREARVRMWAKQLFKFEKQVLAHYHAGTLSKLLVALKIRHLQVAADPRDGLVEVDATHIEEKE